MQDPRNVRVPLFAERPWRALGVRVGAVTVLTAVAYLVVHGGFVVFGHSHHDYHLPLQICFGVATLVVAGWWFFFGDDFDMFDAEWRDWTSFLILAAVPIALLQFVL